MHSEVVHSSGLERSMTRKSFGGERVCFAY